jgi:hypothetical protein
MKRFDSLGVDLHKRSASDALRANSPLLVPSLARYAAVAGAIVSVAVPLMLMVYRAYRFHSRSNGWRPRWPP